LSPRTWSAPRPAADLHSGVHRGPGRDRHVLADQRCQPRPLCQAHHRHQPARENLHRQSIRLREGSPATMHTDRPASRVSTAEHQVRPASSRAAAASPGDGADRSPRAGPHGWQPPPIRELLIHSHQRASTRASWPAKPAGGVAVQPTPGDPSKAGAPPRAPRQYEPGTSAIRRLGSPR